MCGRTLEDVGPRDLRLPVVIAWIRRQRVVSRSADCSAARGDPIVLRVAHNVYASEGVSTQREYMISQYVRIWTSQLRMSVKPMLNVKSSSLML